MSSLSQKTLDLLSYYAETLEHLKQIHRDIGQSLEEDTDGKLSLCSRDDWYDMLHIYTNSGSNWEALEQIVDDKALMVRDECDASYLYTFTVNGVKAVAVKSK